MDKVTFEIRCQDSIKWLQNQPDGSLANVLTGLPDLNELKSGTSSTQNVSMDDYLKFFKLATKLIFQKLNPKGYAIFIQTDRRFEGQLIDKSYLLTQVAESMGIKLLWHKIVCQREIGKTDLFRPTYSHFLCYSRNGTTGVAFPDVFGVGGKLYENGMPYNVACEGAKFIKKTSKTLSPSKTNRAKVTFDVIDPFVGQGTTGVACLQQGLSFLGLDLDPNQCQLSRKLMKTLIL